MIAKTKIGILNPDSKTALLRGARSKFGFSPGLIQLQNRIGSQIHARSLYTFVASFEKSSGGQLHTLQSSVFS